MMVECDINQCVCVCVLQLEERAIQQLELLYQVRDCADEWITVERDITLTEKPTWVKECM